MDNNYLFTIIGKLYVELNRSDELIKSLEAQVSQQGQEIVRLSSDLEVSRLDITRALKEIHAKSNAVEPEKLNNQ